MTLSAASSTTSASPAPGRSVEAAFNDFVAGTFYKQMIKSLRSGLGKPAYFHGGQAEEIFQSQMDQKVAEDLAAKHGAAFSGPLFDAFQSRYQRK